jgi:hypothetical protein
MDEKEGKMNTKTGQYIELQPGEQAAADIAEKKYKPETRTVHLSGKGRKRLMDLRRGIPILESGREQLTPVLDLKRLLKGLLYGLSSVLALTGLVIMIGKNKGELNGGNA